METTLDDFIPFFILGWLYFKHFTFTVYSDDFFLNDFIPKAKAAHILFRNVLGTKCLAEILSEREQIAHWMETTLDEATDPWGVKVERVEM